MGLRRRTAATMRASNPHRRHGAYLCVDRLPADVRFISVTPSHRSPAGATLSLRRRAALLRKRFIVAPAAAKEAEALAAVKRTSEAARRGPRPNHAGLE